MWWIGGGCDCGSVDCQMTGPVRRVRQSARGHRPHAVGTQKSVVSPERFDAEKCRGLASWKFKGCGMHKLASACYAEMGCDARYRLFSFNSPC